MYFRNLTVWAILVVSTLPCLAQSLSTQEAHQLLVHINQATQNLNQFQKDLDEFNQSLNRYYKEFPSSKHARMYREKITGHTLAFVYTEIPYPAVLPTFSHRTDSAAILLSFMQKSYLQAFAYAQMLSQHLSNKSYLEEPQLQSIQQYLRHIQASYADFKHNKRKLLYQLRKEHRPRSFPPRHHPHKSLRYHTIELAHLSQQLIATIQSGYLPEVRGCWEKHQALLKRLTKESPNSIPVLSVYLKQQTQFSKWASNYLEKNPIPVQYRSSARHYYLNEKLIPLYSGTTHSTGLLELTHLVGAQLSQPSDPPIWLAQEPLWFSPYFVERSEEPVLAQPSLASASQFVVLIDASASMQQGAKLKQVKLFLQRLFPVLEGSPCAIVSFSDSVHIHLPMETHTEQQLSQALGGIQAHGRSQCQNALLQAYDLIDPSTYTPHILLFTDGAFELPKSLTSHVEAGAYQGIKCSVLATGNLAPRSQKRLKTFTQISSGRYYHLGTAQSFIKFSKYLGINPPAALVDG